MRRCRWNCGETTKNKSGICDDCWRAAEPTRQPTDAGYRAWLEKKRMQAKPPNPNRQAAGKKAAASRIGKLEQERPVTGLSEGENA